MSSHDWNDIYRAPQSPPWDIGRPQPVFVKLVQDRELVPPGPVLDVGCGTGENAIHLAQNKFAVSGVDYSSEAIAKAKEKAMARKIHVDFKVGNALHLDFPDSSFNYVTDSGLFHVFDDPQRLVFRDQIARVLKPNGTYFMACFSDKEPTNWGGPRRVSRQEIETVFSSRFRINY
ncbi:MAG TPA: class I SAM-dependent methyltransferase, partial [Candidatus Binatus sp.]|nr:class I SAM-dependent methyltransferase [Candidatus Binatus sp.]